MLCPPGAFPLLISLVPLLREAILTSTLPPHYLPRLECGVPACVPSLPPLLCFLLSFIQSHLKAQHQLLLYSPTKTSHFLPRANGHPYMTLVTPLVCPVCQYTMESSKLEESCTACPLASLSGVASGLLSSTCLPGLATGTIFEDIPVRWENSPCRLQWQKAGPNSQWMNAQRAKLLDPPSCHAGRQPKAPPEEDPGKMSS